MTQEVLRTDTQACQRLKNWYALESLKGLGAKCWARVLSEFPDDPLEVLRAPETQLAACGLSTNNVKGALSGANRRIDQILAWSQASPLHHVLTFDHPQYPLKLAEIPRPPLFLFAKGSLGALELPCLAVVGARTPSLHGLNNAEYFARELAERGWSVVSGLARGIDGAAHRAALSAKGSTIAVVGTGIDQFYPRVHINLVHQIVESGGLVISEFSLGTLPRAHHFPRRNRIISGLSLGTLVVEAAVKSGSLLTAREAAEQGRDVFAVPGNIGSKLTEGTHHLIKQGAKLVTTVNDIIEDYQSVAEGSAARGEKILQKSPGQRLARDQLLDSVDFEVTALDVVAERSKMPLSDVLARLLEYELRGLVAAVPGGYIKLGEK